MKIAGYMCYLLGLCALTVWLAATMTGGGLHWIEKPICTTCMGPTKR